MMTDIDNTEATETSDQSTHMGAHTSARTQPHASIAGIARKHGIGTGQLYSWRHQFLVSHPGKAASFAHVQLLSEPHRLGGPAGPRSGLIEIVLAGGAMLRVDAQVDEQALRRVLEALRG